MERDVGGETYWDQFGGFLWSQHPAGELGARQIHVANSNVANPHIGGFHVDGWHVVVAIRVAVGSVDSADNWHDAGSNFSISKIGISQSWFL